jgi:hypothetical protein
MRRQSGGTDANCRLEQRTNRTEYDTMNNHTKELKRELEDSRAMPIFEIEVVDLSGEKDYVTCDISFQGNSIIAQRDGVSTKERASKFIANNRMVVDTSFSLDEHLQALHEMVLESIDDGDLFEQV